MARYRWSIFPPDPFCQTDEGILANLQALEHRVQEILHGPAGKGPGEGQPQGVPQTREGKLVGLSAPAPLPPRTGLAQDH
jgi:hypothetical protein